MTPEQHSALTDFLKSLVDVPWLTHCNDPLSNAIVARDFLNAWDGWGAEMMAVWSPETHALEKAAVSVLGESGVDAIFATVSREMDAAIQNGMEYYFDHISTDETNGDRGLWHEWLDTVKRDLCWAAVETVLDRPGFFTELLHYYRAGRWPCAWENSDRTGRVVVL
jgi:hypothetical protein